MLQYVAICCIPNALCICEALFVFSASFWKASWTSSVRFFQGSSLGTPSKQLPKPRSRDFPGQVALNTKIFQLSWCLAPKTWCLHRRLPNLQLSHIFSAWAARSLTPSSSVTWGTKGDGDPGKSLAQLITGSRWGSLQPWERHGKTSHF